MILAKHHPKDKPKKDRNINKVDQKNFKFWIEFVCETVE